MKAPYKTVKTTLKSILIDYENIQPRINNLVIKLNELVVQTYQFIRLYILNKYNNDLPLPNINEKFISYCLKIQGIRDNRGRKASNTVLLEELNIFYENEFKPLINNDKFNLKNLTYFLDYLAIQMNTAYQHNITEHYIKHLLRFINKTNEEKEVRNEIKKCIFAKNKPKEKSEDCKKWFKFHLKNIVPRKIEKNLLYDLKAYPDKFIKCLLYMNSVLEEKEHKLFQPLPLRNNIVPKYITFDTASLINLFCRKGEKKNLLKELSINKDLFWRRIFKLDKKVFRDKHYNFNYQIQTDGIGVSISFVRKDLTDKKYGSKTPKIEKEKYNYIEDVNEELLEEYKNKNIVGIDPGKKFLVYMVDDNNNTLKYSCCQKRTESMARRNHKILLKEKKKNNIIEEETKLSKLNCKTVNYQKFKNYIKEKNKLNEKLRDFYIQDVWRKMKFRQYSYSRKSEDKLINNIEKIFGNDCVLAYGDWSRTTQMKHFMPTKNIGLRRLIHKKFLTISVNEYNTTKKCCYCHNDLSYVNKSKTIRHLKCSKCVSSENKEIIFRTRDANSAINIRKLFRFYLEHRKRPEAFIRSSPPLVKEIGQS